MGSRVIASRLARLGSPRRCRHTHEVDFPDLVVKTTKSYANAYQEPLRRRAVDDPAAEHRPQNLGVLHLGHGNGEHVAVHEHEVGLLACGD
jgi:hypothetical protein